MRVQMGAVMTLQKIEWTATGASVVRTLSNGKRVVWAADEYDSPVMLDGEFRYMARIEITRDFYGLRDYYSVEGTERLPVGRHRLDVDTIEEAMSAVEAMYILL